MQVETEYRVTLCVLQKKAHAECVLGALVCSRVEPKATVTIPITAPRIDSGCDKWRGVEARTAQSPNHTKFHTTADPPPINLRVERLQLFSPPLIVNTVP